MIQNSDIEGDLKIDSIQPLRIKRNRKILGFIIGILTIFLFQLMCRWFIKLKLWFYYDQESELLYATHLLIKDIHGQMEIHKMKRNDHSKISNVYFKFRHLDYFYVDQKFMPLDTGYVGSTIDVKDLRPLNERMVAERNKVYGNCEVVVPIPKILPYFENEVTSPLYFTQYTSITIFMLEGFFQLAILQPIIALTTSLINYIILRRAMQQLKRKAQNNQLITVYRNNISGQKEERIINSIDLVPGDIIKVFCNQILPCDCLILSGSVLVDEQSLTGESIPVQKEHVQEQVLENFSYQEKKKSILYDGTKVLDIKLTVTAIVLRTGYLSYKGQIFRNALYPKPPRVVFFTDAIKFLIIIAIIIIALYFGLLWRMVKLDYDPTLIALRLGDAIVWIIPPNLVTLVNLTMTATLSRLRFKGILGTQPDKTLEASQTDVICFDKTGTLTTNEVKVKNVIDQTHNLIGQIADYKLVQLLMSSCHQAYLLEDKLIGDTLDIAMAQYSGLEIQQDSDCKFRVLLSRDTQEHLSVIKIFEFSSELARMGVIAKNETQQKYYYFSKGSTEKMVQLCQQVPSNYRELINQESLKGMRIIAMGAKEIKINDINLTQTELETELEYLGLIIFENQLKPDTNENIKVLKQAELRMKIVSGDHILSCINCGFESAILEQQLMIIVDYNTQTNEFLFSELNNNQLKELEYKSINQSALDLLQSYLPSSQYANSVFNLKIQQPFQWAISGVALEQIKEQHFYKELINECVIFARMSPMQKSEIVKVLQQQDLHVCMVGDGSNDCHALKQANVGISFQECDAAMTASFANTNNSIQCVIQVLLHSKATSANVLELFKYYMIINVSKYVSAQLMMYQMQNFNNEELLYLNYFSNIPIIALQTITSPSSKLTKHRINSSMIHKSNFIPIGIILVISGLDMFGSYLLLYFQEWYVPYHNNEYETRYFFYGDMNTQQFITMNLYFLLSFYAINTYAPFKTGFWQQPHFYVPITLFTVMALLIQFVWMDWIDDYLQLTEIVKLTDYQLYQLSLNVSLSVTAILIGRLTWIKQYYFNDHQ